MATGEFSCLLLSTSELDLSVKRRI
ncbi:PREDICTED: humanin-like 3 [Mandrillus leucophaeus]|nr:PREDICTED: humanin-like 3 [Mandrillus leucophaeus]